MRASSSRRARSARSSRTRVIPTRGACSIASRRSGETSARAAGRRSRPAGRAAVRPRGCVFAPRCGHVVPARCESAPDSHRPVGDVPGTVSGASAPPSCRRGAAPESDGVRAEAAARRDGARGRAPAKGLPAAPGAIWGAARRIVQALDDVDLSARAGETLAIVGESGCGKSTFARVLSGLETATAGTAMLGRTEIGRRPIDSRPVPSTAAPDGLPEPRQHAEPEPHRRARDQSGPSGACGVSDGRRRAGKRSASSRS